MPSFRSIPMLLPPLLLLLLLLLLLAGAALPAVVLPRPPSSPNYIPRDYAASLAASAKDYAEKATYQQQSTNVEKPDTQDYRFVEIELRDADNVESLDLHGLVQAVLGSRRDQLPHRARRFDLAAPEQEEEEEEAELLLLRRQPNSTYPQPEVVPRSILGVRDVGLGPSQRIFEHRRYPLDQPHLAKDLGDEKLYYLKNSRPKVLVNFRGRTGNFRQDGLDSQVTLRLEPAAFLKATQPYHAENKAKTAKRPPKKYDPKLHGGSTTSSSSSSSSSSSRAANSGTSSATTTTTENTMVTSSELPKQIPAPPSKLPSRSPIVHTTPVQRFTARRTDILPGYAFAEP